MQIELKEIAEAMTMHWFKISTSLIITTMLGWGLVKVKKANDKLGNVPTNEDMNTKLLEVKEFNKNYTDEKIQNHNELQTVVLQSMIKQSDSTHKMVEFLYQEQIKRNKL